LTLCCHKLVIEDAAPTQVKTIAKTAEILEGIDLKYNTIRPMAKKSTFKSLIFYCPYKNIVKNHILI